MKTNRITLLITLAWLILGTSLFAQEKQQFKFFDDDVQLNWEGADTLFTYEWNESLGKWVIYQRELRLFNEDNKPKQFFTQYYSSDKNAWINQSRTLFTYNERGKASEELVQRWDIYSDDWVNTRLKLISYNVFGKRNEVLFQEWDKPIKEWINTLRYLIVYAETGDQMEITINVYNGVTKNWDNYKLFELHYDMEFTPPSKVIVNNWDPAKKDWILEGRYLYTHNFRSDKTSEIRSTYNQGRRMFVNGIKQEYKYDKKGNMIEFIDLRWDDMKREWSNYKKVESEYTEEGNLKKQSIYKWNGNTSVWDLKNKYLYSVEAPVDNVKPE